MEAAASKSGQCTDREPAPGSRLFFTLDDFGSPIFNQITNNDMFKSLIEKEYDDAIAHKELPETFQAAMIVFKRSLHDALRFRFLCISIATLILFAWLLFLSYNLGKRDAPSTIITKGDNSSINQSDNGDIEIIYD